LWSECNPLFMWKNNQFALESFWTFWMMSDEEKMGRECGHGYVEKRPLLQPLFSLI
jgi:hypothetical protein